MKRPRNEPSKGKVFILQYSYLHGVLTILEIEHSNTQCMDVKNLLFKCLKFTYVLHVLIN